MFCKHYKSCQLALLIICISIISISFSPFNKNVYATSNTYYQQNTLKAKSKRNKEAHCYKLIFENQKFSVCKANPKYNDIRLFLNDKAGHPYKHFHNIRHMLNKNNQQAVFLMNAGMYHKNFTPVGLYIENFKPFYPLNMQSGTSNFFMKPNGVFLIARDKARIINTQQYSKAHIKPQFATQSGPMLVINNKIHPRFIADSHYKKYRNGVGVNKNGDVLFAISEDKINFAAFAHMFRDILKTPNALFLDGSISSIYAPSINKYNWFYALGPVIGVTTDK